MAIYIVIENFDPEYPTIVTGLGDDKPLLFDTRKEAEKEAHDCQNGVVVCLSVTESLFLK
jgi:hypothetical protein